MDARLIDQAENKAVQAVAPKKQTSLGEWLSVWPMLAIISFGSAAVQLAAMHRILVDGKRWISEARFLNALNYCIALPGPEAQLLATYIGWLTTQRTVGGVAAGALFILPGFLCVLAMSFGYVSSGQSALGEALLFGIKPAIVVIILQSLIRIARRFLRTWLMVILAAIGFLATYFFDVSFEWVVAASALSGLAVGVLGIGPLLGDIHHARTLVGSVTSNKTSEKPLPRHTYPTASRLFRTAIFWLVLWFAPVIAVLATLGPDNVFSHIAVLFSKAAVLSVGGPYAVNVYAGAEGVKLGWVSNPEVLDGFAIAELIPGPAVQFVQFLGFLAAYRDPGILNPYLSGTLGALLAAWVTFIPTFLWIFLIAPFIEQFRDHRVINTMLSSITGGMLGVVLTFAIRFGLNTVFSTFTIVTSYGLNLRLPVLASVDPIALGIAAVAAVVLFKFKLGMIFTLGISCAIGFLPHLIDPAFVSSLRNILLGFLAGAAIGFPAGPVAVWCLHSRIKGERTIPAAIIGGSALGDAFIAAGFLAISDSFRSVIISMSIVQNTLVQGSVLILSGLLLFTIATRSALFGLVGQGLKQTWAYAGAGIAFLIAISASLTHPENLLAVGAVFSALNVGSEGGLLLLLGFFLGSLATWAGAIEILARLGEKQGRRIMLRVMQGLAAICVCAGVFQIMRWAVPHLF